MASSSKKSIVFVHPDLGIGGAERLVIDAAVGLQNLGHKVTIFTSYRDKNHCFEEARDGTLDVRVRGDAIFPSSIAGRLSILFAILRQVCLVLSTALLSDELSKLEPDVIFVDQLSAGIPLFRTFCPRAKILFYGHYPDRLLVKKEKGTLETLKKFYRLPFDKLEGWSTSCSDGIVVNSKYTRSVFRSTFSNMRSRELRVIYPCVDTSDTSPKDKGKEIWPGKKILLSINRFEGKKNLDLAIKAYAGLTADERKGARLVLAGGYDPRSVENSTTHKGLQDLADSLSLTHATFRNNDTSATDMTTEDVDILFLLSIPNDLKQRLLHSSSILIYTPENEHFGIVPLEAMLAGVPVLATNTGGPLETIYDGRTGWLRSPEKVAQWTDVLRKPLIPSSAGTLRTMGEKGRERVLAEFSHTKMTESLDKEVQSLCVSKEKRPTVWPVWFIISSISSIVLSWAILVGFLTWKLSATADGLGNASEAILESVFGNNVPNGREEL